MNLQNVEAEVVSPIPMMERLISFSLNKSCAAIRNSQYSELSNSPSWGKITTSCFFLLSLLLEDSIGEDTLVPVLGSKRDVELAIMVYAVVDGVENAVI